MTHRTRISKFRTDKYSVRTQKRNFDLQIFVEISTNDTGERENL